jgi:DNA (cytosine-5)-methyltransferase 1
VKQLTFISLFSGIGGLDLGLERAGLRCVAQVENDDYACQVLARRFPDVTRFRDVRECGAHNLPAARCVTFGFPCTDLSYAGRGAGLAGARSGLYREGMRIVGELRPDYVLVENVAALLNRGLGTVLGDLAALRYDAEWECVPACALGAPHTRDRVFVLAYPQSRRWGAGRGFGPGSPLLELERCRAESRRIWAAESRPRGVAYGISARMERLRGIGNAVVPQVAEVIGRAIVAHATEAEGAA